MAVKPPAQMKLAGFTDEQAEEIEGILEHYNAVETRAKEAIKAVRDREQNKIDEVATEVIEILQKYDRQAVALNGWTAQIVATMKVKVKGSSRKKKQEER